LYLYNEALHCDDEALNLYNESLQRGNVTLYWYNEALHCDNETLNLYNEPLHRLGATALPRLPPPLGGGLFLPTDQKILPYRHPAGSLGDPKDLGGGGASSQLKRATLTEIKNNLSALVDQSTTGCISGVEDEALTCATSSDLHIRGNGCRLWNLFSSFPHPLEVKIDGFPDQLQDFLLGLGGGNTARKVGNIGAEVGSCLFDDDGISHGSSPAT